MNLFLLFTLEDDVSYINNLSAATKPLAKPGTWKYLMGLIGGMERF